MKNKIELEQILQQDDTKDWTIQQANALLLVPNKFLSDKIASLSHGGKNDYYSNGDYWWPDPKQEDGLPYIQRDGQSNPDNFSYHRTALREMRTKVAHWSMAYYYTKDEKYVTAAVQLLQGFFVEPSTKMNPHLQYAQAIPGITPGRGIGIIDTLHITEVPYAVEVLKESPLFPKELFVALQDWFGRYLHWMLTDPNGVDEMNTTNNHAVCFFVQVASFARFTGNQKALTLTKRAFKERLLLQMEKDGSFPRELARTKPYSYSLFVLDNMAIICQILSTKEEDLWNFQREDGKSLKTAFDFLTPYLYNKDSWPYAKDVEYFSDWPARQAFMLYGGLFYRDEALCSFYYSLPMDSAVPEVRRNVALRQPLLLFL